MIKNVFGQMQGCGKCRTLPLYLPDIFVSTGVKKLALLAQIELTDDVKENHESLSKLVHECGIPDISHDTMTWTGDQKVLNDCCGIGNHKSTYPCAHCLAKLPFTGGEKAELRTLGHLDDSHDKFVQGGSKIKDAKKYFNCINKRFIHGPRNKKVIECFPPPTLHYKLRSTNYILDECASRSVKMVGRNLVKEFAIGNNIVRKSYHSGEFEVSLFLFQYI